MNSILFVLAGHPVSALEFAIGMAAIAVFLVFALLIVVVRTSRERGLEAAASAERARELDDKMAELNRIQAEMTGRMQTVAEIFGTRQTDLVRHLAERLDNLQHRVGQGLEATQVKTGEHLTKLAERLAVIDAAQKNLSDLTSEMVSLKDVLANKQSRGAFGQARMEAIVQDGLPNNAFGFQVTLSNRTRPDCVVHLPGDKRPLVIDAKFPLEGFSALRAAQSDEARKAAEARVRADLQVHIKDVAEKYLLPGETQDIALLFVPSEAVYADLVDQFDELIQKAHRARVIIVSPSLLMMAIQVMLAVLRDHRMREEAQVIQSEVRKLLADVGRLQERVTKLDNHFRQAQDDVAQIKTSSEKISRRGEKIDALDFDERPAQAALPGMARTALDAAE